jgi:hypothetical protein
MAIAFRERRWTTPVQRKDLDVRAHGGHQVSRGLNEDNGGADVSEMIREVHQRSLGAAHAEIVDEEQGARCG